ncbi:hypothetical protein [Segniliparus rugosus]|nr:hypothetical protein [Segniliparus rugosus]
MSLLGAWGVFVLVVVLGVLGWLCWHAARLYRAGRVRTIGEDS